MSLCSQCSGLSIKSFRQTRTALWKTSSQLNTEPCTYLLWDNGHKLEQSRLDCAFCALLWAALRQERNRLEPGCSELLLEDSEVRLEAKADSHKTTFPEPPSDGHHLTSLHVIATAFIFDKPKLVRGKVRLFTTHHSPFNTSDIIGRPRLSGVACENTISLLRGWVAACKEWHNKCSETLSGEIINETHPSKILPHRVLHIDNGAVRIVQSNQRHGRYVALSHCWGPPEKRPIRALKSNIQDFERDIPWDLLPKTYQDAIIIVRSLDIPYIWIDSLCIVQDDRDDWLRESAFMGSVYERAEFTIAASHAFHSQEGFLHMRPDQSSAAVELPSFLSGPSGTIMTDSDGVFARLREDSVGDAFPENGALNERAWATQEWLLSRRMLFFTPATIMWSCKNITQRETGERCFNISRNVRWKTVIEAYSERKLTYPTDKLVALEGLHLELHKKLNYTYLSGIWEENLPDQLLWQVAHKLEVSDVVNPLSLPSWTWARMPCGVRFMQINGAKNMCHLISVSDCKSEITIRSRMKALPTTTSFDILDGNTSGDVILSQISADVTASHAKATSSLARLVVDGTRPIGWVVYDEQTAEQESESGAHDYMLALMGTLGRRDYEIERLHDHPVLNMKRRQYWCMILRKGKEEGKYYRVGVGKSYSREWWLNASLHDVTLS